MNFKINRWQKIVLWYRNYRDIYEDTKDGLTQRDRKYFGNSVDFNIQRLRVEEEKRNINVTHVTRFIDLIQILDYMVRK